MQPGGQVGPLPGKHCWGRPPLLPTSRESRIRPASCPNLGKGKEKEGKRNGGISSFKRSSTNSPSLWIIPQRAVVRTKDNNGCKFRAIIGESVLRRGTEAETLQAVLSAMPGALFGVRLVRRAAESLLQTLAVARQWAAGEERLRGRRMEVESWRREKKSACVLGGGEMRPGERKGALRKRAAAAWGAGGRTFHCKTQGGLMDGMDTRPACWGEGEVKGKQRRRKAACGELCKRAAAGWASRGGRGEDIS